MRQIRSDKRVARIRPPTSSGTWAATRCSGEQSVPARRGRTGDAGPRPAGTAEPAARSLLKRSVSPLPMACTLSLTFAIDMDACVGRRGSRKHVGEEGRRSDRMRANDRTDFVSLYHESDH